VGWSKRAIVVQSFEEAGLAAVVFDLEPEQLDSALRKLDTFAAELVGQGIRTSYALSADPEGSDLDDDSGLPATDVSAYYLNLSLRIGPAFGKTIQPDTRNAAKAALDGLIKRSVVVGCVPYSSTLPRGTGNRRLGGRSRLFYPAPDLSPLRIVEGGGLNLGD
jgi:hypothetical protein